MFFLIRVAFWLSVVALLLPTPQSQKSDKSASIAPAEAFSAAAAAVSDMRQFCTRQPEACTVGSQAAQAFGDKAQASAKMVYDFFTEKLNEHANEEAKKATENARAPGESGSQSTLTSDDRAPSFRGPQPRPAEHGRRPA
jgi:hypothetical protein